MKKRTHHLIAALSAASIWLGAEAYAQPYIYPSKGQSQEQQERDKFECYNWARQQTGFDPTAPSYASTPPPPKREAPHKAVSCKAARAARPWARSAGRLPATPAKGRPSAGPLARWWAACGARIKCAARSNNNATWPPREAPPPHKGGPIMSGPNGHALRGAAIPCNRGEHAESGGVYQNTEEL